MKELFYCAMGAAVLALLVTWVLVRANRRQNFRSAADARRRIGEPGFDVNSPAFKAGFIRGGTLVANPLLNPQHPLHEPFMTRVREMQTPTPQERARRIEAAKQDVRDKGQDAGRVVGLRPEFAAPYRGVTSTPAPTPPDSYMDNPILNPIHPLHSAFVPTPSYEAPAPSPTPSYDCPSPSPSSYDSGSSSSSSSCDSPSPSPSSDW